jgi:flagellar M-ring protein FliF
MSEQIQVYIDRVGGPRRASLIAAGLALSILIFALSRWAAAPTWVPVFSNLPIESVGTLTDRLDAGGIRYRLEQGGSQVTVPSTDLARARVTLAQGGGVGFGGRPGLELFDQPSWGMTDFTQRINYRRALEGELERTIGKMRGVQAAKVHLAITESSSFRRADRPGQASVVLSLHGGATPPADMVQGIAHLVASSVDGIQSENVTVVDDLGRMLSIPHESGGLGLTSRQLSVQREVEEYLERKAERIVSQMVGPGNSRIQVSAALNFDRIERTTELLDPDRQAVSSETRAEIVPGPQGGAGSVNVATQFENSRSLENFSSSPGAVQRLSVAVLVADRVVRDGDGVVYNPRSAEELRQIETLVAGAVGIDPTHGDVVSVVGTRIDVLPAPPEPAFDFLGVLRDFQRLIVGLVGLLLAFFLALRVLAAIRQPQPAAAAALPGTPQEEPAVLPPAAVPALPDAVALAHEQIAAAMPDPAIEAMNTAVREKVAASVMETPEAAARLVRAWLKEDRG